MKAVPFAAYVQARRSHMPEADIAPAIADIVEVEPAPDLESIREEARTAGFAEGYAAAVAEYEQKLAAQESSIADRIEAARHQTIAREAGVYKRQVARELGKARKEIEAQIAPVLKSMFAGAVEQRACEETRATLRELLQMRKLGDIQIAGPEKYLRAIREGLGGAAEDINFVSADQPDISISFGQTTIRTQIAKWKERLEQLPGAETHV